MKLSAWVLVGLLMAGAVAGYVAWRRATEPARAWTEFLELEGVDLRALRGGERERVEALFERFAERPPWPRSFGWSYVPWMLVRPGEPEWMVLATEPEGCFAGAPELRIAHAWHPRRTEWQTWTWESPSPVAAARAERRPETGAPGLLLEHADGSRWHFLLFKDDVVPVRYEGADGAAREWPGVAPAPTPPLESSAVWARSLEEGGPAEVLCRLGWMRPSEPHPRLLGPKRSAEVQDALHRLQSSPNPWIREAAELALRP